MAKGTDCLRYELTQNMMIVGCAVIQTWLQVQSLLNIVNIHQGVVTANSLCITFMNLSLSNISYDMILMNASFSAICKPMYGSWCIATVT